MGSNISLELNQVCIIETKLNSRIPFADSHNVPRNKDQDSKSFYFESGNDYQSPYVSNIQPYSVAINK